MWGRRKGPDTVQAVKAVLEGGGARAISALDDLLRHAEWEGLTEGERGMLLAPLQGKQPPLLSDGAPPSERDAGLQLQDWVAQLVGVRFQPEVASVVRVWLESGAPDGHLYVGGRPGQGRTGASRSAGFLLHWRGAGHTKGHRAGGERRDGSTDRASWGAALPQLRAAAGRYEHGL